MENSKKGECFMKMNAEKWIEHIKILVLCLIFTAFGNWLATMKAGNPVTPLEAVPGLCLLFLIAVIGLLIWDLTNGLFHGKNLPTICYSSFVAIICTVPGVFPFAGFVSEHIGKVGLLPLCTPILAYAGISLGKDMDTFRKQGVKIFALALFAFAGAYFGSATIAQVILKLFHVI